MKKRLLSFIIIFALITGMVSSTSIMANAESKYTDGQYTYVIENGKAVIIEVDREISGDIVIPSILGGYPVSSIGKDGYGNTPFASRTKVTSVIIPEGVTSIGWHAFNGCSLERVTLPTSLENIGSEAFLACDNLKEINIPKNVEVIENRALDTMASLVSITVDPDNLFYSSLDGVLFNKNKTDLIQYPDAKADKIYTMPNSVTVISCSFSGCSNLENLNISERVTEINLWDYHGYIKKVYIPKSVTIISEISFAHNTEIHYAGSDVQWNQIKISKLLSLTETQYLSMADCPKNSGIYSAVKLYNASPISDTSQKKEAFSLDITPKSGKGNKKIGINEYGSPIYEPKTGDLFTFTAKTSSNVSEISICGDIKTGTGWHEITYQYLKDNYGLHSVDNGDGTKTWTCQFYLGDPGERTFKVLVDGQDSNTIAKATVVSQNSSDNSTPSTPPAVLSFDITPKTGRGNIQTGIDIYGSGVYKPETGDLFTFVIKTSSNADKISICGNIRTGNGWSEISYQQLKNNYGLRSVDNGDGTKTWTCKFYLNDPGFRTFKVLINSQDTNVKANVNVIAQNTLVDDETITPPTQGGGFTDDENIADDNTNNNNSGSFSDTPQQGQEPTNPDGTWGDQPKEPEQPEEKEGLCKIYSVKTLSSGNKAKTPFEFVAEISTDIDYKDLYFETETGYPIPASAFQNISTKVIDKNTVKVTFDLTISDAGTGSRTLTLYGENISGKKSNGESVTFNVIPDVINKLATPVVAINGENRDCQVDKDTKSVEISWNAIPNATEYNVWLWHYNNAEPIATLKNITSYKIDFNTYGINEYKSYAVSVQAVSNNIGFDNSENGGRNIVVIPDLNVIGLDSDNIIRIEASTIGEFADIYIETSANNIEVSVSGKNHDNWLFISKPTLVNNAYLITHETLSENKSTSRNATININADGATFEYKIIQESGLGDSSQKDGYGTDADSRALQIYNLLTEEYNYPRAAAYGILTNMYSESWHTYHPLKIQGDSYSLLSENETLDSSGGNAFGIVQWDSGRKLTLMKNCNEQLGENSWRTIPGQVWFLNYEIQNSRGSVPSELEDFYLENKPLGGEVKGWNFSLPQMKPIVEDSESAYNAGYAFCRLFERPRNAEQTSQTRGNNAKENWNKQYYDNLKLNGVIVGKPAVNIKENNVNITPSNQYNRIYTYNTPLTTYTVYAPSPEYSVPMYTACDVNSDRVADCIASQECTILEFYDNDWCKVQCASGIGYVQIYKFILNYKHAEKGVEPYKKDIVLNGTIKVNKREGEPIDKWTVNKSEDSPLTVVADDGNAHQIIYKVTGKNEYKMGWVEHKIFENSSSQTATNGSTNTSAGYVNYNGVNYTSILEKKKANGEITDTEYNNRIKVLNKARDMVTVIWTAPITFHTWKSSELTYNSNNKMLLSGNTSTYHTFTKGCQYVGVPYAANANHNKYDDIEWQKFVNKSNISLSELEGSVNYLKINRPNCTFNGIDCSGFVYKAYLASGNYKPDYLTTADMLSNPYWHEIDAAAALPGDVLLKSGHVMIYAGKTSDGKVAAMESVADGERGTSGCRYFDDYTSEELGKYKYYRYKYIGE